jgi:hypothetical protein
MSMRISDVTIRNANNGFILEWYDDDSRIMIYETMDELVAKIRELLED